MEISTSRMILLNGLNFQSWKEKMKDLLYIKNYFYPIFIEEKPKDKIDDQWKVLHFQACKFIYQFVEDNVLTHIADVDFAKDL